MPKNVTHTQKRREKKAYTATHSVKVARDRVKWWGGGGKWGEGTMRLLEQQYTKI